MRPPDILAEPSPSPDCVALGREAAGRCVEAGVPVGAGPHEGQARLARSRVTGRCRRRIGARGRRATAASLLVLVIAAGGALLAPGAVSAACFAEVVGGDGAYTDEIAANPRHAIDHILSELANPPARALPPSRAHLYAMLVDAYEEAGDLAASREAAALGSAALTRADSAGLRRRLQFTPIMVQQEQGQIQQAAAEYERLSTTVPEDAPEFVCVLGDRGYLRFLSGRMVDAATDALRSYQLARDHGYREVQLQAGQLLARIYSQYGLYDDALALARDAVDYYAHARNRGLLSDAYLFRGEVLYNKGDYASADMDFRESRKLLEALDDKVSLAFTLQRMCTNAASMRDRTDAAAVCREAYASAVASHNRLTAKIVLAAQGMIEYSQHHPQRAIELWNTVLADDGIDVPKTLQTNVYGLRGRARAGLGDVAGALSDRNAYIDAIESAYKTEGAGQVALLNMKFALAVKDQQLAVARAESRAIELDASRRALKRTVLEAATVIVVAILATLLGAWLWHRRRLESDARQAAEERLAAVARMSGGVAHDFNNLLGVAQQAVGLLRQRPTVAADAGALELVKQVKTAGELCSEITSQLLSFARLQNLKPEVVDTGRFLREVLSMLQRTVGDAVEVSLEIAEPAPLAWVDPRQLTAALLNLAGNARDALREGGAFVIRVASEDDGRVRIDAIDNGIGMPPDVLARAVEPFYSTKAVGRGSGLGLSMVQGFATQSGGSFAITSSPAQGTVVTLHLPRASAAG